MLNIAVSLVVIIAVSTAFPTRDDVIAKMDPGPRFQYVQGPDGDPRLVDMWLKASDVVAAARFTPDTQNVYHLFTRQNPSVSQPLVLGYSDLVMKSNFDPQKKTKLIVHGWGGSAFSSLNTVLVPAFLAADDVNVLVVDWNAGAGFDNYVIAVLNTITSGEGVARFISWLSNLTGSPLVSWHLVGHSLGGHHVGITGRNLDGQTSYITSLDPAGPVWYTNSHRFRSTDGVFTEVLHTNVGVMGYLSPIGDVDFYPNGGLNMPGCSTQNCDHDRCFYYLAESLTAGGFTGHSCATYNIALTGNCDVTDTLHMGGLEPKTGASGIYHLLTNAASPFSQG